MRRHLTPLLAALAISATLASASTALARPPTLRDGAPLGLYAGAGFDVVGLRHFPEDGFAFQFGLLSTDTATDLGGGLFAPGFRVPSFSGGITLGNLAIGAELEGGWVHLNPDGPGAPDTNNGYLSIIPQVEYFLDGDSMAPFFGGRFGPTIFFPDRDDADVWLEAGGIAGIALFVTESFSVLPKVEINFLYDSQNEHAGWEIFVMCDLRGWIPLDGGGGTAQPEPEPAYEPAPQPAYEPAPAQTTTTVPADPESGYE
ncbi:MAG: hypothetical protein AB7S26_41875 [Sandaracinaceae bacterium]